ncbi:hypothetical protein DPSP01_010257 [Paraphaeosphaeria sporulosa]
MLTIACAGRDGHKTYSDPAQALPPFSSHICSLPAYRYTACTSPPSFIQRRASTFHLHVLYCTFPLRPHALIIVDSLTHPASHPSILDIIFNAHKVYIYPSSPNSPIKSTTPDRISPEVRMSDFHSRRGNAQKTGVRTPDAVFLFVLICPPPPE